MNIKNQTDLIETQKLDEEHIKFFFDIILAITFYHRNCIYVGNVQS